MIVNRPRIFLVSFVVLLISITSIPVWAQDSTSFTPGSAQYLWPTNASHALSGVFSETRSGHFHAALDIKTWGQRGYPIYATRAGKLHRIAIGPTGYGKVLYLKHDNGSYSVYAHLLRFNKQLRLWSDSLRLKRNINAFDIVVDSLNIHFDKGDQIALSGASGIGPPHLHFELRTPNEQPFNPLLTNLKIRDTIAPTFSGLAILPLSVETKIEGKNRIYTMNPSRKSVAADFGTVTTSGRVGLAIDVFDQANGVPNVYAVYQIQMEANGREVFASKVNQFSYAETGQLNIDRVYPLLQSTGKGYQRLFVADGNTLSFYRIAGNGGRLNLPPGQHTIRIEVKDFYGNTRQARLSLQVKETKQAPVVKRQSVLENSSDEINPNSWTWFNNWVNIPVDDFERLSLTPLLHSPVNPIYYQNGETVSVDLSSSPQFYFRTSPIDFFITRRVLPDEPSYVVSPDERAFATFESGTFYDTTSVAITQKRTARGTPQINLIPDNQPLHKSFTLRARIDSSIITDSTLSFYKTYPGSRYLRKVETDKNGAYLSAKPSSLGRYVILPDTTAPRIRTPRIVQSPDDFWLIYIPAYDRRSGIDYRRSELYVNGVRGITEYEPEDGRLVYYHPEFEPKASNEVRVVAFDEVGNRTIREFTISP